MRTNVYQRESRWDIVVVGYTRLPSFSFRKKGRRTLIDVANGILLLKATLWRAPFAWISDSLFLQQLTALYQ